MRLQRDWGIAPNEAARMTPNQIGYLLFAEQLIEADKARFPQTYDQVVAYVAAVRGNPEPPPPEA